MNKKTEPTGPLTIITTHLNPDYDAVGSMVAAGRLYPEAILVFPGGSQKNLRHFFIQSLIHLLNPVKAKDLDLSLVGRLVVVDTRQPGRIGDLKEVLNNPGLDIHLYDHHPDAPGDLSGSVEVVAEVGSTVTILTEILEEKNLELMPEEATMMAVGLYEDTGAFTFDSTTSRDYAAAAALLKRGADLNVVSQLIVRELTAEQLALLNVLIDAAESRQVRGLNFVVSAVQVENYVDDLAVLAHKMMEIMGISTLFVMVGMDQKVQLVIRSRLGSINAAEIAREFDGGGHASAAAASIKGMSLNEARSKLEIILSDRLGRFYQADNLMVYPPITIAEWQTLAEAQDIMVKFSINVLLTVNRRDETTGFISEHNVSKALYHGLFDYPVSAFMNTEFASVTPEAPFAEVKEIIVDRKQRVLPVMEGRKAVGVITRTDLLQVLSNEGEAGPMPTNKEGRNRRNLAGLMREQMGSDMYALLKRMGQLADHNKVNLYAVGGFVRDLIMRQKCQDIDLTMDGDISDFINLVKESYQVDKIIRHPRFKTATLKMSDGYVLDISTTRREYYEHPGALPVVQTGSLRMDMYRRDFTINSLALALNNPRFGELVDYYRGFQDIKDGYVRVLHNLSFVEDPTRAFRAVRFEARLGFKISKMTANLIEGAVKNNFLTSLEPHRMLQELRLILNEDDPAPAINQLHELGLLKFIHPALTWFPDQAEMLTGVRRVLNWLALTFPEQLPDAWLVYLMVMTDRLNENQAKEMADSLGLKNKEVTLLTTERAETESILNRFKKNMGPLKPSLSYDLFSFLSWPAILFIMSKTKNEELAQAGVLFLTKYRLVKPEATGSDIISWGVPKGPSIRRAFEELRRARIDGLAQTKADEEAFIKSQLGNFLTEPGAAPKPLQG